jgi:hypothetical protein
MLNLELEALSFLCNVIPKSESIEQSIQLRKKVKEEVKTKKSTSYKKRKHSKSHQEGDIFVNSVIQDTRIDIFNEFNNTPEFKRGVRGQFESLNMSSQKNLEVPNSLNQTDHPAKKLGKDDSRYLTSLTTSTQRNSQRTNLISDPKIVEEDPTTLDAFIDCDMPNGVLVYKFSNKILDFITSSNQPSRQESSPRETLPKKQVQEDHPSKKNFVQMNKQCSSNEKIKKKSLREKHFGSISSQDDIQWAFSKNIMPLTSKNQTRRS